MLSQGLIHGTGHLYIGEEAVAVGACAAIRREDYITSTHRGHGHCLAKGADLNRMMAELFGKETGYCGGKGGSMHIADLETGNLGANGIVGGSIGIACGAGITCSLKGLDRVVVCFFGDGALNQGVFHESANLAAAWKLPVIFVCENNQYAMSTSKRAAFSLQDLSQRAVAYGMPGKKVDGNDVLAVYHAVAEAVSRARQNEGPSLIVAETYRWKGHSRSDAERYRSREEVEQWKQRCPIQRFRTFLISQEKVDDEECNRIGASVEERIAKAVAFARQSPFPGKDSLEEHVFSSS
jgi:pyruvate dehydrogenase E1 component alpha subunit